MNTHERKKTDFQIYKINKIRKLILCFRYYRQTWVGKQLGGKDIWFAVSTDDMVCP